MHPTFEPSPQELKQIRNDVTALIGVPPPALQQFVSRFGIGEGVFLNLDVGLPLRAFVRAIIFSASKVRYSLWLPDTETTLHNVDSALVEPDPIPKYKDFGEDNYS